MRPPGQEMELSLYKHWLTLISEFDRVIKGDLKGQDLQVSIHKHFTAVSYNFS